MAKESKADPKTQAALKEKKKKYDQSRFMVKVRYDSKEKEILLQNAKKAGINPTAFVRNVSLNPTFKIVPAMPLVNVESKSQILKIGINLNQIARALNNYYEVKNFANIEAELVKVTEYLRLIYLKLDGK